MIEAFPNAFLGVLLPEVAFASIPPGRGRKFDALFEAAQTREILTRLLDCIGWADAKLRRALVENTQHDERAALICAVTAVCVWRGRYTAVGDRGGGWFFLPPWSFWEGWAQRGIENADVEVWCDGVVKRGAEDTPHGCRSPSRLRTTASTSPRRARRSASDRRRASRKASRRAS
jgi:hypothetical protein